MTDDTGGEDTGDYDPNDGESRGTSGFSTGEIDLSKLTANYTAKNGETLTGTLRANVKVSIADGATVTLRDATINGVSSHSYEWAGISCEGDAVINLAGTNTVTGFHYNYPGIHIPAGKTLTIKGDGKLAASNTHVNNQAAGIGGGWFIPCGNIVIEGGIIDAKGGIWAAGIGGGGNASCGNITITGGTGTAQSGRGWILADGTHAFPDSIGAGAKGSCGKVTIYGEEGAIAISPYTYPETRTDLSTITANYTAQNGEILTGTLLSNVKVSIADGASVLLRDVIINGEDSSSYDWPGLTCAGDATIFLKGNNTIRGFYSVNPGIYVPEGKTLTIMGDGALNASSNGYAAGIGGGYYGYSYVSCGNIVINGGNITATGGWGAAGIGSGYYYSKCSHVTINGGTVTATGGERGAGIGSGYDYSECDVTINGGKVTATGGKWGAGIGSGYWCIKGDVKISGGTIIAKGGEAAAGIGGGDQSDNGSVTISGGTITAIGGYDGAGIGGGYYATFGDITINGGTIKATGGEGGAGIGNGYLTCKCGDITINGGTISATGGKYAAGIGPGYKSYCSDIVVNDGTVNATGGKWGAGIGCGAVSECGNIEVNGGTVNATGGEDAAGIGTVFDHSSSCKNITISRSVTKVTATNGGGKATHSIGAGTGNDNCGTVTIGGDNVGQIEQSPYTYPTDKQ